MKLRDYLTERLEFKCPACGNKEEFSLTPSDKQLKCPKCNKAQMKEIRGLRWS